MWHIMGEDAPNECWFVVSSIVKGQQRHSAYILNTNRMLKRNILKEAMKKEDVKSKKNVPDPCRLASPRNQPYVVAIMNRSAM